MGGILPNCAAGIGKSITYSKAKLTPLMLDHGQLIRTLKKENCNMRTAIRYDNASLGCTTRELENDWENIVTHEGTREQLIYSGHVPNGIFPGDPMSPRYPRYVNSEGRTCLVSKHKDRFMVKVRTTDDEREARRAVEREAQDRARRIRELESTIHSGDLSELELRMVAKRLLSVLFHGLSNVMCATTWDGKPTSTAKNICHYPATVHDEFGECYHRMLEVIETTSIVRSTEALEALKRERAALLDESFQSFIWQTKTNAADIATENP
jgi:hypothetical protein